MKKYRWMRFLALTLCSITACTVASGSSLDDARALHRQGDLDAALASYDAVVASDADDRERAVAHNNACVILTDRGSYTEAARRCALALELRRAGDDARGLARTLNNAGRVLERLGDYDAARDRHLEALAINRDREDLQARVVNHQNLAVLEIQTEVFAAAFGHLGHVRDILAVHTGDAWVAYQEALLNLNQGVVQEKIGAYRDALESLDHALEGATRAAPGLLADVHLNRGVVLRNLGDPVAALDAYDQALALFDARGDRAAVASVYLNKGLVAWDDLEDLDAALVLMAKAQGLSLELGDFDVARQAIYFALRAQLDAGQTDNAVSLYRQLVALRQGNAAPDWVEQEAGARVALARGQRGEALTAIFAALDQIEQQRSALTGGLYKQRLLNDRRGAYALAVDILYSGYRDGDDADAMRALSVVGRAKALALVEATGSPLLQQPFARLKDLRDVLGESQLLEYFFGTDRLHIWSIDRDTFKWTAVPRKPVEEAVQSMRDALRQGQMPVSLGPLTQITQDVQSTSRPLIVAPDGSLTGVPFELMAAGGTAGTLSDRPTYYVPSAHAGLIHAPRSRQTRVGLTAFARAETPMTDNPHPALRVLASLGSAREEVRRIERWFDGRSRLRFDDDATETALRELSGTAPGILHFASHAVFDSRLDDGAVLILGSDGLHDGLMAPRDVAGLQLRSPLIVLSACSTALGESTTGAPMTNLTGAFMAAGAGAVLTTLWDVGDAASLVFMEQFYAQLAQGLGASEALLATKRRLAASSEWSSPAVWAGYVLYGDSGPLFAREPQWRWPILALLALLAGVFAWSFRPRRIDSILKRD